MSTVLITGINGFLGSNLAKMLSSKFKVIGLEYSLDNLFRLNNTSFKIYSTSSSEWKKLFKDNDIDIIIHTATFYGRNNEKIIQLINSNFLMPLDLLKEAKENSIELFINTDTVLDRFVSPYALTKRHFQEWLFSFRNDFKIFNMKVEHFYGRDAPPSNFITSMLNKLRDNVENIDLTLGNQERNFVHINDVCSAYEVVISKSQTISDNYSEFHVGTKEIITIKELMIYLKKITNSSSNLNFGAIPHREFELMTSKSINQKLTKLGWIPKLNFFKTLNDL